MNIQTEAAYKAYFESLATSHVSIDFFLFGDENEFVQVARKGVASDNFTLWLDYYPIATTVGEYDTNMASIKAEFVVMKPASPTKTKRDDLQVILKQCEDIVKQIFAKIEYDYQQSSDVSDIPIYDSIEFGRMEPVNKGKSATRYEGIAAKIDFHFPIDLNYDNTKWS